MKATWLILSAVLFALTSSVFAQAQAAPDPKFYVFLCFGQSNMEGVNQIPPEEKTGVDPRFQLLPSVDFPQLNRTKGEWTTAVPPLVRSHTGLCPGDYFGRTLVAGLPKDVRVGVVAVAVGGCKIELFQTDQAQAYLKTAPGFIQNITREYGGSPYARLVEMGKLAQKSGVIKGILLHQGESNTNDKQWPAKVKAVYEHLLQDLDLTAQDVPLLSGELAEAKAGGKCAVMNKIIDTLPETIPTAHVISSKDCPCQPDGLHFTVDGYKTLGTRYGETMLGLLNAPAASAH